MNRKEKLIKKLAEKNIFIKENILINDNDDTITSRIDGSQRSRIYGQYLLNRGLTSDDYLFLFPNAPISSKKDRINISKNSGKYMKEQKYKDMFSEKIKGGKNPNDTSKTTEQERKERSPFSIEFYKKKFPDLSDVELEEKRQERIKEMTKDKLHNTQLEFYLKKGFSEEEAKKLLSERQTTFSLKKCIEKYGEEKGIEVFNDRQNKWQTSLTENGNSKGGFSAVSQELFDSIIKYYENTENVYYEKLNYEHKLNNPKGGIYKYDFTDFNSMKIIEYNGDLYHANPKYYKETDTPNPYRLDETSAEIWKRDENKKNIANQNGFELLTIWDSEYLKYKEETIQQCLSFLKINKNLCK